ncbi:peroxin-14 [Marchantia polymorpha subsp. ruderalis]|uniref:Peroxisomal membrane protein PEX14 n=2 Tax=Marchantia polymorpha TaxID=3197 RepID=A0AAF6C111_MARPO|nr:hypothetical protein MARPO_0102s0017 [Marchantia polymorpha]PTQ32145.1 hypothetical protein MARPO_0102s0017 [Marchantia polymorpha]BBN17945.1 hypothetical protein Mp_7g18230 [Marchantia polymorpha subsp. ruderalis]BBN17946.1 hypothetical protein Mp_7g18230 [Marchantia polymorpha subsp. ruderalis]|eukprot:PTQ32143.1 hypothetical protein MARPO_0102s0017 [Marchantia polymorpha]
MAATVSEPFLPPAASPTPLAATTLPGSEASNISEAPKNDNWRFIEPQPIREDQVENAVKFLSHPKVKGSPIVYRRSFLEKKGLSREEIDEAFRRVPDPPSDSSTGTLPTAGAQSTPVAIPKQMPAMQPGGGQLAVTQPKSTSWAQMVLALGVLTAAGAGAGILTKRFLLPKFKHWIRYVVLGESAPVETIKPKKLNPVEEATAQAAAAAAAAATAATQMAGAMQEIAHSRAEDRQRLDNIIRAVEAQTQELKNALAGMKDAALSSEITKYPRSVPVSGQANGFDSLDYWKGQTNGSRPSSASEIRGDKAFRAPNSASIPEHANGSYNLGHQARSMTASPTSVPTQAPHSQSYMDVIAMLERGEKPPGIREVNDKPPNPNQPPSNPRLQPRPKPWEKSSSEARPISPIYNSEVEQQPGRHVENRNIANNVGYNSTVRTEAASSSGTGGSSEPWWRKKTEAEVLPSPPTVKITEVDPVTENEVPPVQASVPSPAVYNQGTRSGWVPPSVPQPIYPGAHEAIRRPKSAVGSSSSSQFVGESGYGSGSAPLNSLPPSQNGEAVVEVPAEGATPTEQSMHQPEQHDVVSVEREPDVTETALVDPNRTFKDVVNED